MLYILLLLPLSIFGIEIVNYTGSVNYKVGAKLTSLLRGDSSGEVRGGSGAEL